MMNGGEYQRAFRSMLPALPPEMLGQTEEFRDTFGHSKPYRAFHLLRRTLAFLVREVVVDEGLSLADKLRFVHAVTTPEYRIDPAAGLRDMNWAAAKATGSVKLAYVYAADVFYACRSAKSCPLNTDRFELTPAPAVAPTDLPDGVDVLEDDVLEEAAHH